MQIIKSLNKLLETSNLFEEWLYIHIWGQDVEYCKNPARHELQRFLREAKELRAINDKQNNWYFWKAEDAIHTDFSKKVFNKPITDYYDCLDNHIYQLRINRPGIIDHYLFQVLMKYFYQMEFDWNQIKAYMEVLLKRINPLLKTYNFKFSNTANQLLKEIVTGEAFE